MKKILSMFVMLLVVFSMLSVNVEASQVKYTKSLDNKFKSLNKYNYVTFEQTTNTIKVKENVIVKVKNVYTFNLKERYAEIISTTTSTINDIDVEYSFKVIKNLDTGEIKSEDISGLKEYGLSADLFAEDTAKYIETGKYNTMYDVYKNFLGINKITNKNGTTKGKYQVYKLSNKDDIKVNVQITLDTTNYKPVKINTNIPKLNIKDEITKFKFSVVE